MTAELSSGGSGVANSPAVCSESGCRSMGSHKFRELAVTTLVNGPGSRAHATFRAGVLHRYNATSPKSHEARFRGTETCGLSKALCTPVNRLSRRRMSCSRVRIARYSGVRAGRKRSESGQPAEAGIREAGTENVSRSLLEVRAARRRSMPDVALRRQRLWLPLARLPSPGGNV